MPRGRLAKLSDADLAEYALKYHVDAFRRSKRSGINQVHHVKWGWMTMERYYELQKVHDLMPLLEKAVEGGYRAKAALWGATVSVAGFGIPLGLIFPSIAAKGMIDAYGSQNVPNFLYWAAAFFLPFGEVLTVKTISDAIGGADWAGILLDLFGGVTGAAV